MEDIMDNWNQNGYEKETAEENNMKLTERFLTAMFSPKDYKKLLHLPMKKMVSYFLCLFLLITLIWSVIPKVGAIAGMGGFRNIVMNRIPDFEIKDGTFTLSEKVEINDEDSGIYILMDTEQDSFSADDVKESEDIMESILVSRTNMIISTNVTGMSNAAQEYKFSEFGNMHINNETLAGLTPLYYMALIVSFIFSYIGHGLKYLVSALFYAVFIYFMVKAMMLEPEFGEVYKVALYAKTVGSLVEAVTYCIGGSLVIMAGSTFHLFMTLMIMNRVYFRKPAQV
jgi:hypothetical protein